MQKKVDVKKLAKRSRKLSKKKNILDRPWAEVKREFDMKCDKLESEIAQSAKAVETLERLWQ